MMHRETEQQGFVDHLLGPGRSRSDEFFRSVDRVIDWSLVQDELKNIHVSKMGAPSFQPLMLFKALLIQRWYDLSDPATEDALNDRKSFARFVGLPLDAKAPDHTTLWRFRELLIKRGLMEPLLAALMAQIETAGLILKEGTLLDATFVPSAVRPPSAPRDLKQPKAPKSEGETSKPVASQGEDQPLDPFKTGKRSRLDPDAAWAKKGKAAYFGFKLHIAVDQARRIIRAHKVTAANVNDCVIGPDLVLPDGGAHYADKAYSSEPMRQILAKHGLADGVMQLGSKHYPLRPAERRRNAILATVRAAVEGVFGESKTRLGLARARYRGIKKVQFECDIVVFAFNLKTLALA